ncbi:MAG TPA: hypothetical protein VF235_01740 [Actinomycetota bacterium]
MRILVLYESRRGFTLTVARAIRDELRARGLTASAAPLGGVDAGTLAACDALIVGTWVAGKILVGVGPPREALAALAALPALGGRPAAVFCTYDAAPRGTLAILAARLVGRGARVEVGGAFRNGPLARTRRRSLATVPAFVDEVHANLERLAATVEP